MTRVKEKTKLEEQMGLAQHMGEISNRHLMSCLCTACPHTCNVFLLHLYLLIRSYLEFNAISYMNTTFAGTLLPSPQNYLASALYIPTHTYILFPLATP